MGSIQSVSLPSGLTCRQCGCNTKCYAKRIERRRKSVRDAYQNNLNILRANPTLYWREIEASIMLSRFFRFHVSGDIPDATYLCNMIDVAARNKHCEILCFTKKYELVNNMVLCGVQIPKNLHILFSIWQGLDADNPHRFPEAHVRYKDGTITFRPDVHECQGNCTECAITNNGCWTLSKGEQIVFNEH